MPTTPKTVDSLTDKTAAKAFLALVSDEDAKKETVVAALTAIESAWKIAYADVKTLQDFHGKMLDMAQMFREDCKDLKNLDGRTLRGTSDEQSDKKDDKKA